VVRYAVWAREYSPGAQAPTDGVYEQCNVLGSATGTRITLASGQKLPAAPRGFTWRMSGPPSEAGVSHGGIGRAARSAETD
jgi:hypothetical protein